MSCNYQKEQVKFGFCCIPRRGTMSDDACLRFVNLIGKSVIPLAMCHFSKWRKSGQNTSDLTSKRGVLADAPCCVGLLSTEYILFRHALFGDFSAENMPKNAKNRPIL